MDIKNVKKLKLEKKDVMREYAEEPPKEFREKKEWKESKMDVKPSRFERAKKAPSKTREWLYKKTYPSEDVLEEKARKEELKARIAVAKQQKRSASPLSRIGPAFERISTGKGSTSKGLGVQSRLMKEESFRRGRQQSRQEMEYEREYHKKFGIKQEGEGELPYYKSEHKKPLPVKCSPDIGITNGERISKKKSLKDELL